MRLLNLLFYANILKQVYDFFLKGVTKKLLLLIFLFNTSPSNLETWRDWRGKETPFMSDGDQYYSYLIGAFVEHDMSFSFHNYYWLTPAPNGNHVPKVTMGMAYLYTPPFLLAHAVEKIKGNNANGYTQIYAYANHYWGILVVFIGLLFLRKVLLRYFSEWVTSFTILSVYLGSNLMYYTLGWNMMPHAYLFTIFTIIMWCTVKWYEKYELKYMLGLGFLSGLCVLIRPTEIVLLLIPFLYKVITFNDLKSRFGLLWDKRVQVMLAAVLFILPWIPQFIYWKEYTGSYMFYTYGEEGFYFFNPQFFNVLFSYRKGWFVYTPVMIFAVLGFIFLKKKCPDLFWGVLLQFLITFYLISAWWCWWWGGCLGMRSLIHSYAFLAVPMACFYSWAFSAVWRKLIFIPLILCMSAFSMYNCYRYKLFVIHWDSMTKEAFWYGIGKTHFGPQPEGTYFETLLEEPDYSKKGDK